MDAETMRTRPFGAEYYVWGRWYKRGVHNKCMVYSLGRWQTTTVTWPDVIRGVNDMKKAY